MTKVAFGLGGVSFVLGLALWGCGDTAHDAAQAAGGEGTMAGSSGHAMGGSAAGESGSGGAAPSMGGSMSGGAEQAGAGGAKTNYYADGLRTGDPMACSPRSLPFGDTGSANEGRVSCSVAELRFTGACDCTRAGRAPLQKPILDAALQSAKQAQSCGGPSGPDCAAACGCEIVQLPGTSADKASQLYGCQNDATPPAELAGFCVIDEDHRDNSGPAPIGNPDLVANCPANNHRRIRFVGAGQPAADASTFLACAGQSL